MFSGRECYVINGFLCSKEDSCGINCLKSVISKLYGNAGQKNTTANVAYLYKNVQNANNVQTPPVRFLLSSTVNIICEFWSNTNPLNKEQHESNFI